MAAGVTDRLWSVEDLVVLWEAYEQRRAERADWEGCNMLTFLLAVTILSQAAPSAQAAKPSTTQATPTQSGAADTDPAILSRVRRIYVEGFGDDLISKEIQSMIVSALVETKRFKVTENRERADAILKGVALEKTSQEIHAYQESTAVGGASGGSHAEINGSVANGNGNISGSSTGGFAARHAAISDSSANAETINDARIAIRLVSPDGDVIWTSTQESR